MSPLSVLGHSAPTAWARTVVNLSSQRMARPGSHQGRGAEIHLLLRDAARASLWSWGLKWWDKEAYPNAAMFRDRNLLSSSCFHPTDLNNANGFQIFLLDAQHHFSNPTYLLSCAFLLAAAEDISNVSTTEYEPSCLSKSS